MADPDPLPGTVTAPKRRRWSKAIGANAQVLIGALWTIVAGIVGALALLAQLIGGNPVIWLERLPPPVIWAAGTTVVLVTFIVGAVSSKADARRAGRSVLDARRNEQQLARARQELAAIEQEIADRTIEYAQLGERLKDASAMLKLTEEQTASVRRFVEQAVQRTKRTWWLSLLAFLLGIGFGYLTEWTAPALKPPWFP